MAHHSTSGSGEKIGGGRGKELRGESERGGKILGGKGGKGTILQAGEREKILGGERGKGGRDLRRTKQAKDL